MKTMLMLLWFFVVQSLLGCRNPQPETYLIPYGFKGRVNIIFNQPTGKPPIYENGRRVYAIPNNGILLTQFRDEYGIIDHQYFYVNQDGSKNPLKIFHYEYNKDGTTKWIINDSAEIGIFLDGITGSYGNDKAKFQEFIVSSYSNLDSFYKPNYRNYFEKTVQQVMNNDFLPDTLSGKEMKKIEERFNQNDKSK